MRVPQQPYRIAFHSLTFLAVWICRARLNLQENSENVNKDPEVRNGKLCKTYENRNRESFPDIVEEPAEPF